MTSCGWNDWSCQNSHRGQVCKRTTCCVRNNGPFANGSEASPGLVTNQSWRCCSLGATGKHWPHLQGVGGGEGPLPIRPTAIPASHAVTGHLESRGPPHSNRHRRAGSRKPFFHITQGFRLRDANTSRIIKTSNFPEEWTCWDPAGPGGATRRGREEPPPIFRLQRGGAN